PRPALAPFPTRRSSDLALLLATAGDGLEALRGRAHGGPSGGLPPPRPLPLILAAAASIAAALLTPYGFRGWSLPVRLLTERIAGDRKSTRLNSSHVSNS